jgi:glycosyltransferase involved in cell wall biosynthesis
MARPFVSILIDTYNHERFIEQAVVSALEQDFPEADREILVVDDGSTDRTPEIVRKFQPRLRVLRETNGGQASAFNAGIPECKGQIVAFLDGDDWWDRNKLQAVASVLEKEPDVNAVGHAIHQVDEAGMVQATLQPDRGYRVRLRSAADVEAFLPLRAFLGASRFAARRSLLNSILPIPKAITIEADEFVFTMAAALSEVTILQQPLTNYRLHSGNLYQFAEFDQVRMSRKQKALASLAVELRVRLRETEMSPEAIAFVQQSIWVDAERLRLSCGAGWPWETFLVERAAHRIAIRHASVRYRLFQMVGLAATLVLPPKLFYAFRRSYSRTRLPQWRARLAKNTSTDDITVRSTP